MKQTLFSFAVLVLLSACSKHQDTQPSFNFTTILFRNNFANIVAVGDTARFMGFHVADNSTMTAKVFRYSWDFGDGNTEIFAIDTGASENNATHVYSSPGTYRVRLNCDNQSQSAYFTIKVIADPGYVSQICSPRLWTGGRLQTDNPAANPQQSTLDMPDTSFAIQYRDKISMELYGRSFVYAPDSSSAALLVFKGEYNDGIRYYPTADSVSFFYIRKQTGLPTGMQPIVWTTWYHNP